MQPHTETYQPFSKFDFVKSYIADIEDLELREKEERKATIIADAIQQQQRNFFDNLATKEDLQITKKELELKIEQLRADTKHDIENIRKDIEQLRADNKKDNEILKKDLTIRMTIIMGSLLTGFGGIFKLLSLI